MKTYNYKKTCALALALFSGFQLTCPALPTILDSAVDPANGHTYDLLTSSDWTDAENEAITLGGHLAAVRSMSEDSWIWNKWGANRSLWIGLYDPNYLTDGSGSQHAADFIWSDGETSTFRNWNSGEPNNGAGGPNEGYTYILAGNIVPGGLWNDWQNLSTVSGQPDAFGVVEVVPEPSGLLAMAACLGGVIAVRRIRE